MTLLISKTKEDWTFKEIKTQEFTHGLHQYPARMHPEIAKRLIAKFTSKNQILYLIHLWDLEQFSLKQCFMEIIQ